VDVDGGQLADRFEQFVAKHAVGLAFVRRR